MTDDISLTDLSGVFKKEPVSACVFMNEERVKGSKFPDLSGRSLSESTGDVHFPNRSPFEKNTVQVKPLTPKEYRDRFEPICALAKS